MARALKRTRRTEIERAKATDPERAKVIALEKDLAKEEKVGGPNAIPKDLEKDVKEKGARRVLRPRQQPRPRPRQQPRLSQRELIRFQTTSKSQRDRSTSAKGCLCAIHAWHQLKGHKDCPDDFKKIAKCAAGDHCRFVHGPTISIANAQQLKVPYNQDGSINMKPKYDPTLDAAQAAPGDVGPGDWICPNKDCKANVFASTDNCYKCNTPKPGSSGGQTRGRSPSKNDEKSKKKDQRPDSPAPRRDAAAAVPAVMVSGSVTKNTQYAVPATSPTPVCDQWELTGKCNCD